MSYLHQARSGDRVRPQLHRDIKPANILVSTSGHVKLSDFGCLKSTTTTVGQAFTWIGTKVYMSPERVRGDSYNTAADIWSFGVVAYECAVGSSPFKVEANLNIFEFLKAIEEPITVPPSVNPYLTDMIYKCLQQQPQHRSSATELLQDSAFFKGHDPTDDRKPLKEWIKQERNNRRAKRGPPSVPRPPAPSGSATPSSFTLS
uniref:mitogen-activated protein kinase kinase n=1 Tax=Eutreptiella gymnastica TaxID=73025 RepID=A0A7S4G0H8_9EUGL